MLSVSGVEVTEIVDTQLSTWKCSETKHEADKVTHMFSAGQQSAVASEIASIVFWQAC